jgi:uncharacterized membrane protein
MHLCFRREISSNSQVGSDERTAEQGSPFLFLNWLLTIVSTFQSPLILLSQIRQNEMDRERMRAITSTLEELTRLHLETLRRLQELTDELRSHHRRS